MNMRTLLDFHRRMEKHQVDLESNELDEYLDQTGNYINEKSEEGKRIVLERMSEENFVILARELEGLITSSMMSEGLGVFLMMAKTSGELESYTHTIILATLAILIEEKII